MNATFPLVPEEAVAKLRSLRPETRALLLMQLEAKLLRGSLSEWSRYCEFTPAPHHLLLIDRLERIARGEIDRLAVFMPPGSAKSTYGSVLFVPWYMAAHPGRSII